MFELTKDADKLTCCIYKMYLEKRNSGMSKEAAKSFDENFYKNEPKLSKWNKDDILDTLLELHKNGLIKLDIIGNFTLENKLIVYMENRFKNGLFEIVDFVSKFI